MKMYCSSCGSAAATRLDYCNRCGARLVGTKADARTRSSEVRPEMLVNAILCCFVFGLGAIIGLLAVMRSVFDFNPGLIIAFTLLSFMLLTATEGVFVWMLLRRTGAAKKAGDAGLPKKQTTTNELDAARAGALPEPVPSVTEHTTRTFEPIYVERKSE